jgi:hypothetical protein
MHKKKGGLRNGQQKGDRMEPGICRRAGAEGYIAEVNYPDPQTCRQIRE